MSSEKKNKKWWKNQWKNLINSKNLQIFKNKPLNFCLSNDWKKKTRTFQTSTLCTAELTNVFIGSGCWPASRCCFLVYIALFFTHSTIPTCGTIQLDFFKRWLSLSKKKFGAFQRYYLPRNKQGIDNL